MNVFYILRDMRYAVDAGISCILVIAKLFLIVHLCHEGFRKSCLILVIIGTSGFVTRLGVFQRYRVTDCKRWTIEVSMIFYYFEGLDISRLYSLLFTLQSFLC